MNAVRLWTRIEELQAQSMRWEKLAREREARVGLVHAKAAEDLASLTAALDARTDALMRAEEIIARFCKALGEPIPEDAIAYASVLRTGSELGA